MNFALNDGIVVLGATPAVLQAMLAPLPPVWTNATEGPDTWSPFDIVGHLVHGERTDWVPRATLILARDASRTFEPYDRFAQFTESRGKSLPDLLTEFAQLRAMNLDIVRRWELSDAHLALEGQHPAFGTVTLRQLLSTWVAHDLSHIAQVARVMARQYRDAVGPWREYLPLLDR